MSDIEDVLNPKTRKPKVVAYYRVSSRNQAVKDSIKSQKTVVRNELKKLKIADSRIFEYEDNGKSGTLGQEGREGFREAVNKAYELAQKGPVAFVARDVTRYYRDARKGMGDSKMFYDENIPMVFLNDQLVTGTRKKERPNPDAMFGIKLVFGGQQVATTKDATKQALEDLKEKGIFTGRAPLLYPLIDTNVFRYLYEQRNRPLLADGTPPTTQSSRGKEIAAMSGVYNISKNWNFRQERIQDEIIEKVGAKGYEDILDLKDYLRQLERKYKEKSRGMAAVKYQTSGSLRPEKVPNARPAKYWLTEEGKSRIEMFRNNPNKYMPRRRRK